MKFIHDPNSNLDYTVDWSDWLAVGETIAASTWVVPVGLTAGSESETTNTATQWISGGTVGTTYTLTNRITTSAGRIEDRSLTLVCRDK